ALELLQLAEQSLEQLQRLRRQAARCEAMRRTIAGFAAETAALLGDAAGRDPGPALRAWQAARDRELARLQQLEHGRRQLAELQQQAALLQQQLERCEARRLELLQAAEAEGEEALRRRYVEYRRRLELLAELRQEELALRTLAGDEQLERLNEELERRQAADLEETLQALQENLESSRGLLEHVREEKTRRRYELDRLISGGDHVDKLQTVEERRAELQRLIRRWAVHAMCSSLFVRTKKMYEHEKQPSVMQRASVYFERVTAGRYVRMLAPLGEQKVLAEKENGEQLDTVHLSRGTAEQMYLCIRFALADEYAASGIQLPLVIDDLFVNFDDERLGYGLDLLRSVAERHQLLLFTCHRHVLDAYASRFPAASVSRLTP
ncbi:ATP-binding protein, partial [Paenibacillus sp. Pae15]|uniref:ATP-binding protein n=1 Tax=Paenibacillus sp. Pae15 TaxID=2926018 RepID=UPI0035C697BB